jgi:hypothetical protein
MITSELLSQKDELQQAQQGTDKARKLRGIAKSVLMNAALPFVVYSALTNMLHTSDFVAVVASGVPPLLDSALGIVRSRRIDFLAGFVLVGLVAGLIPSLMSGSTQLLLVRESLITGVMGLVYLASLLTPRPMAFYFSRYFVTGNDPTNIARFNDLWQHTAFRHAMRLSTVVWGIMLCLEAATRAFLVYRLSTAQFLLVSPFVLYGFLGVTMAWTMWYARYSRRKANQAV